MRYARCGKMEILHEQNLRETMVTTCSFKTHTEWSLVELNTLPALTNRETVVAMSSLNERSQDNGSVCRCVCGTVPWRIAVVTQKPVGEVVYVSDMNVAYLQCNTTN